MSPPRPCWAAYSNSFSLPGTESTKALDLLTRPARGRSGDTDTMVWHVDAGVGAGTRPSEQRIDRNARTRSRPLPSVASVSSPYDAAGAAQISQDGQTAYATVTFDAQATELTQGRRPAA